MNVETPVEVLTPVITVKKTPIKIKIGSSLVSEHIQKDKKIKGIRKFLEDEETKCCACTSSCFNVFGTVANQTTCILKLRMKFFQPLITKKMRRGILSRELLSMVHVSMLYFLLCVICNILFSGG